jgi:hypothetical protein
VKNLDYQKNLLRLHNFNIIYIIYFYRRKFIYSMYKLKFINLTNTFNLEFLSVLKKNFGHKFKTEIKKIEIKKEVKQEVEKNYILKPKYNENSQSKSINLMSNFEDEKLKNYYSDLRKGIMNFEDPAYNHMYLWYGVHLIPAFFLINQLPNFIWVYHTFWITTSLGLVYSTYEFYSSEKEKKIMDHHIIMGYFLILFCIFLAVLQKYSNKKIRNLVYFLNSLNSVFVYFLYALKRREFYIPKPLKKSMKFLILILTILSLFSIYLQNSELDEEPNSRLSKNFVISQSNMELINLRYLKELKSN